MDLSLSRRNQDKHEENLSNQSNEPEETQTDEEKAISERVKKVGEFEIGLPLKDIADFRFREIKFSFNYWNFNSGRKI